jgi:hypothetical protein
MIYRADGSDDFLRRKVVPERADINVGRRSTPELYFPPAIFIRCETAIGTLIMRSHLLLTTCALIVSFGMAGVSQAAEVVVHERAAYPTAPVADHGPYRSAPAVSVETEGPVVYGWSYRPPDCGVYHYWNGDECVDARVVPPLQ